MEEKIYDLLEKMYIDLTGKMDKINIDISSRMDKMDGIFDKIELTMATKHDIVRLEDKMDKNFKALYDGYSLTYEKVSSLEDKIDIIDKKINNHDVEIKVIKRVANI